MSPLRNVGMDTQYILRRPGRLGLSFLETGANQRPSQVIYDRDGSSISPAAADEFPWQEIFAGVGWFHVTGITPAVSRIAAETKLAALEAAKRVASDPHVFFLIVGEGSAKRGLRAYADELGLQNVRFLTTQPRELLPQLLGSADLSLVTLRDGMGSLSVPSKSYAIMASARPMLAAVPEDSAVRDLVLKADCGLWIRPDHPETMAKAILSLLDQPDRLEAMGQRGRELAEREFARPIGTARYRELLLDLAEQRSHPG
ncbi:MAG: glycosyltransferase [Nitrospirae bacterium]|nr:glycosyltransferase [Nitrospirota bacterium]